MLFILLWEGFSLCVSVSVQGPVSLATANDAISAKQGRSHQSGRWNLNKLFLWVRPSEWGGIWGIGDSSIALWCAGFMSFSPREGHDGACGWPIVVFLSSVHGVGFQDGSTSCYGLWGRCYHMIDSEEMTTKCGDRAYKWFQWLPKSCD